MKRYESLNGLRAYAAIGIVLMHVRANIDVNVTGNFLYNHIIPAMSDFVFLFMMVSAFLFAVAITTVSRIELYR